MRALAVFGMVAAFTACGSDEDTPAQKLANSGAGSAGMTGRGGSATGGSGGVAGQPTTGGTSPGGRSAAGRGAAAGGIESSGSGRGGSTGGSGGERTDAGEGGSAPTSGTSGSGPRAGSPSVEPGVIFGFGVNGQPRNWGSDGSTVKPVLERIVNDMGASFFRIEFNAGQTDWEAMNDDDDPTSFNWDYFDDVFESKPFTDLWDYIRYVNGLGVSEVALAAHGYLPTWMGSDGLPEAQEDEFVETLVAAMVYARTRAPEPRPTFTMLSPFNETSLVDIGEGFWLEPDPQGVRVVHKLIARMNQLPELDGIALMGPDEATEAGAIEWRNAFEDDSLVMQRLRATTFHRYSGPDSLATWTGAAPPMWLTEFNSTWLGACYETDWTLAFDLAGNLISALESGVTAGLVWSDYDAPHSHQDDQWQTFGLFEGKLSGVSDMCDEFPGGSAIPSQQELDAMDYQPKPTYYAAKHAFAHIRPGARRVNVDSDDLFVVGFQNPDGSLVVYGRNQSTAGSHSVSFTGMTTLPSSMLPHVSSSGSYDQELDAVSVAGNSVEVTLPSAAVFALVGE